MAVNHGVRRSGLLLPQPLLLPLGVSSWYFPTVTSTPTVALTGSAQESSPSVSSYCSSPSRTPRTLRTDGKRAVRCQSAHSLILDIIALLVISILMIASFFLWEHHVEKRTTRPPLMRLALWTRAKGKLAATYFIGGISWMGFSTMFYSATLFYQQVQMTGTIGAMLRFMPTTISGLLCNILVAKIVHIVPNQILICVGIAATGLSNIFFAIAPRDAYYWRLPFNAMWLTVLGADFLMAVGSIFVSTLALPEEQSVAGALFQTLVQLGGALGLAFVSVVQTSLQHKALANGADPVDALLKGLHGAFWFAAGASFTAFAIAAVVLRDMGKPGTPNRKAASTRTTDSEATAAETEKQVEAKV